MTQKNVYILGAGFSKEAGAPLLNDFLPTSRDLFFNKITTFDDFDNKMFDKVFKYHDKLSSAKAKINFDIDNLETIFSIIDMNISYINDCPEKKEFIEIRSALIYLIIKTLEDTIQPITFSQLGNVLERFIKALVEKPLYDNSIITFNYDLILEKLLAKKGKNYDYSFESTKSVDNIQRNEIKLLKLHGSSNWNACPKCEKPSVFESKLLGERFVSPCGKHKEQMFPSLIPPTWNKRIESPFMRNVWLTAFTEIQNATNIIIIGYSLPETDLYFRHFLTLSLKDNMNLKNIYIVNNDDNVMKRYKEFFENNFSRRFLKPILSTFKNVLLDNRNWDIIMP